MHVGGRSLVRCIVLKSSFPTDLKLEQLEYSVFTSVLKAVINTDSSIESIVPVKALLAGVLEEHGIVTSDKPYFDALVNSLSASDGWSPTSETISFVDNCMGRISRQPVHYQDLSINSVGDGTTVPLLLFSVAEQWPFRADNISFDHRENTGEWIVRLLQCFEHAGLAQAVILDLKSKIIGSIADSDLRKRMEHVRDKGMSHDLNAGMDRIVKGSPIRIENTSTPAAPDSSFSLEKVFGPVTNPSRTTGETRQFKQSNITETLQHYSFKRLCEGLSSSEEENRRQAFLNLQGIMHHAEASIEFLIKYPLTNTSAAIEVHRNPTHISSCRRVDGDDQSRRNRACTSFHLLRLRHRGCRGHEPTGRYDVWESQ